jgi:hypothetical protein
MPGSKKSVVWPLAALAMAAIVWAVWGWDRSGVVLTVAIWSLLVVGHWFVSHIADSAHR